MTPAVPPEGTRSKGDGWKTGFYHIASGAGVPIVLGYIDYRRKVAGLGPAFTPTGDIEADFREFAEFYRGVTPKYPDDRSPVIPSRVSVPLSPRSSVSFSASCSDTRRWSLCSSARSP